MDEYRFSSLFPLPPLPKWQPPPLRLPPLPTVKVCGVDVHISKWMPKDWIGTVDGQVMAGSEEAAAEVLGRIVWTSPPCYLMPDGTLVDMKQPPAGADREQG